MEIKQNIYLSLGSNSGNREDNILFAIDKINKEIGEVTRVASNFENEAQGFESETLFLNTAIHITSALEPLIILKKIKKIEQDLGRLPKKSDGYESRTIDIDIILIDDVVFESKNLRIPHLSYRLRDFVLIPLTEIAPLLIDPITCLTSQQLLDLLKINNCMDSEKK